MGKKEIVSIFITISALSLLFFHKTLFKGLVPFPGDILASEYKPWSTSSYLGFPPGGIPTKAQYPDTIRQLYPWRMLAISELKNFRFPLWNPYNFSGTPLLANFQSAAFYPLNVLFFFFSTSVGWAILVIAQPILAFIFTYLYSRKIGLSPLASLMTSLSYGFCGYMTVWFEYNTVDHVILWLPLVLYSVETLLKKITSIWIIVLTLSLTFSLLAGHPQVFTYLYLFVGVYTVIRARTNSALKLIVLLLAIPIGLGAVVLFPGIELITLSARSQHPYEEIIQKILIQPWQLLMIIFPNIFGNPATRNYWPPDTYVGKVTYIGLVPLLFLPAALRSKSKHLIIFGLTSITVLFLTTNNPITQILYKINIPFFRSSSPTLMLFLLSFSLSMLSGIGLDKWIKENHDFLKLAKRLVIVGMLFMVIFIAFHLLSKYSPGVWSSRSHIASRALLYVTFVTAGSSFLLVLALKHRKFIQVIIILLLCVQAIDLHLNFAKFNPFTPKDLVFPEHSIFTYLKNQSGIYRFWGYGTAAIEANFATLYQVYSPDGYDPLYPRWYGEIIASSRQGAIPEINGQTRSDATIAPGYGERDLPENLSRKKILDALSVKYVLDRTENASTQITFPKLSYQKLAEIDGWRIYQNLQAIPRAYIVHDHIAYINKSDFAKNFFYGDLTKRVLLEYPFSQNISSSKSTDSVNIISYESNKVIIETTNNQPGILVLTDTYYPGWTALIDSTPAPILKANYAFRSVVVPEGKHSVTFIFQPLSFEAGKIVSLTSVLLLIIIAGITPRLYNKYKGYHE